MNSVDALFASSAVRSPPSAASASRGAPAAGVDALFADASAPHSARVPVARSWKDDLLALPDAAASIASGTLAQPIAGLAGLLASPLGGMTKAAEVVQGVQNALTWQPRTQAGSELLRVLGYPMRKLAQGANWAGGKVAQATRSPLAGALTNAGIQGLPLLLSAKLPALREARVPLARVSPEASAARAADFKLTPNQVLARGNLGGRVAESLAGHAKLERQVSRANSPTVAQMAAREAGINGPVSDASIAAAKAAPNAVYEELSQLGDIPTDAAYRATVRAQGAPGAASFPADVPSQVAALRQAYDVPQFTGADAVARIRQLRKEGNQRVYGGRYDPDQTALGHAQLSIARALEGQIHRHLQGLAAPELREPVTVDAVANNASGESAASQEAVNRAAQERAAGQSRFVIDPDGRPTPLLGVDAVDARAPANSILVQRGIGEDPFTILDRDGLPKSQAQGLLARARALHGLDERPEAPASATGARGPQPNGARAARDDWAQRAADLIPRFRQARTQLAKIHNVERAWRAGKREAISALSLAKQLDKGAPLTGGLRTIAEAAQRFPRAFQDLHKIRDNGPFSALDLKIAGPLAFFKPEALLPMLGPPGIRRLLGSDWYQRRAFGPFNKPRGPSFPAVGKAARALPLYGLAAPRAAPQQ